MGPQAIPKTQQQLHRNPHLLAAGRRPISTLLDQHAALQVPLSLEPYSTALYRVQYLCGSQCADVLNDRCKDSSDMRLAVTCNTQPRVKYQKPYRSFTVTNAYEWHQINQQYVPVQPISTLDNGHGSYATDSTETSIRRLHRVNSFGAVDDTCTRPTLLV